MINVTVRDVVSQIKKYPYVGKANNCVVLFWKPCTGVCIASAVPKQVGDVSDDWCESNFDCVGETIIKSEI